MCSRANRLPAPRVGLAGSAFLSFGATLCKSMRPARTYYVSMCSLTNRLTASRAAIAGYAVLSFGYKKAPGIRSFFIIRSIAPSVNAIKAFALHFFSEHACLFAKNWVRPAPIEARASFRFICRLKFWPLPQLCWAPGRTAWKPKRAHGCAAPPLRTAGQPRRLPSFWRP